MKRLLLIVGTRPNFVKIDPILRALDSQDSWCSTTLVHTGQHYDEAMSESLFVDLGLRKPEINLGISGGSHAQQTARVMVAIEELLQQSSYDLVIVVGDVNSTLAATLAAVKLQIPVAHIEAGLRSGDRTMPEEINRLCVDAISTMLFTTSRDANDNLYREGVPPDKVHFVGNVMIDTMLRILRELDRNSVLEKYALTAKNYAILTAHRPSNVDSADGLNNMLKIIQGTGQRLEIVFPLHPRTLQRLKELDLLNRLQAVKRLKLLPPLGYRDFLALQADAAVVLTDSGGIQEETTVLGIPCLTLRENTERPITVSEGTNLILGTDYERVMQALDAVLDNFHWNGQTPEYWDGHAAARIAEILRKKLGPAWSHHQDVATP